MSPLLLRVALLCVVVGGGCIVFGLRYSLWHNGVWRGSVLVWAAVLAMWMVLALAGVVR